MNIRHPAMAVPLLALLALGCDPSAAGPTATIDAAAAQSSLSASAATQTSSIPVPSPLDVPCPDGETVDLTGSLRIVMTEVESANGNQLLRFHIFSSNVSGTGQTTGARYRANGGQNVTFTAQADGLPTTFTSLYIFHVIGQGQAVDFHVHETIHMTVNANGELTASVADSRVACR